VTIILVVLNPTVDISGISPGFEENSTKNPPYSLSSLVEQAVVMLLEVTLENVTVTFRIDGIHSTALVIYTYARKHFTKGFQYVPRAGCNNYILGDLARHRASAGNEGMCWLTILYIYIRLAGFQVLPCMRCVVDRYCLPWGSFFGHTTNLSIPAVEEIPQPGR
jgi:hypothetical protein